MFYDVPLTCPQSDYLSVPAVGPDAHSAQPHGADIPLVARGGRADSRADRIAEHRAGAEHNAEPVAERRGLRPVGGGVDAAAAGHRAVLHGQEETGPSL